MPADGSEGLYGDLRGRFSRRLVALVSFGGSLGENPLVGDRGEHLAGAVAPLVVVGVDQGGDVPAGLFLGGEVPA